MPGNIVDLYLHTRFRQYRTAFIVSSFVQRHTHTHTHRHHSKNHFFGLRETEHEHFH